MLIENADEYKKWLTKVQKKGYALQHVPDELKTKDLCLAAVQVDGSALKHVPEVLKTEALCLAALQENGYTLEYVIQPTDRLAEDAEQLARWNRILMEADETDQSSKYYLQAQLIDPLITQVNKTSRLTAPVVDEIAILIEHCERLRVEVEPIKELYCEKQRLAKPKSKHRLTNLAEFSL